MSKKNFRQEGNNASNYQIGETLVCSISDRNSRKFSSLRFSTRFFSLKINKLREVRKFHSFAGSG